MPEKAPSKKSITTNIGTKEARIRWGTMRSNKDQDLAESVKTEPAIPIRLAKMGFLKGSEEQRNEVLSSPEEIKEASDIVKKITSLARFGYQIPAYSLDRVETPSRNNVGEFAGIIFPGTQNDTSSIWDTIKWIEEKWGNSFKENFPESDLTSWFQGQFKFTGVGKFSQMFNGNEQRITIFRDNLKKPNGDVSVLGMPAIDTEFYGYPPYSNTSGRPSKSLTYIKFDDPDSKAFYEQALLNHKSPLRLQNAINSIIFSPDVTKNIAGMNSSKGYNFIVKDGTPNPSYYSSVDFALSDFAGFGFDLRKSTEKGDLKPRVT